MVSCRERGTVICGVIMSIRERDSTRESSMNCAIGSVCFRMLLSILNGFVTD